MNDPVKRLSFYMLFAACIWIILYLWFGKHRKDRPNAAADLCSYQRQMLGMYDEQIALLKGVKFWYLLPLYVAMMTFYMAPVLSGSGHRWDWIAALTSTVLYILIWILNEVRGVRKLRQERDAMKLLFTEGLRDGGEQ
jgi:hypothetical protein